MNKREPEYTIIIDKGTAYPMKIIDPRDIPPEYEITKTKNSYKVTETKDSTHARHTDGRKPSKKRKHN
ncbi:MAG: hypothetical protein ABR962_10615 [Candidatus Bathyarchaeia archaeon]|jgi:hypothetical protein